MKEIIKAVGLEETGITVFMTTRRFGDMHFARMTQNGRLGATIWYMRHLTGYNGNIIAPRPRMTQNIFLNDTDVSVEYRKGLYRVFSSRFYDGALIEGNSVLMGENPQFRAYALALADSPIGIIYGESRRGGLSAVCMHLGIGAIRSGIIQNGLDIAKKRMHRAEGFFMGLGISPEAYKYSLNAYGYVVDNAALFQYLRGFMPDLKAVDREFSIDLLGLTEAILHRAGFQGEIIRESSIPCTASSSLFFSNSQGDKGRNCVLVIINS